MVARNTHSMENLCVQKSNNGSRYIFSRIFRLVSRYISKFGIRCGFRNHRTCICENSLNLDGMKRVFPIIVGLNSLFQFLVRHFKALTKITSA